MLQAMSKPHLDQAIPITSSLMVTGIITRYALAVMTWYSRNLICPEITSWISKVDQLAGILGDSRGYRMRHLTLPGTASQKVKVTATRCAIPLPGFHEHIKMRVSILVITPGGEKVMEVEK